MEQSKKSKEEKEEFICEECGAEVDGDAKECPNCHSLFEEEVQLEGNKELISEINKLGNTWLDILAQTFEYILFCAFIVLALYFFLIGLQGGITFGIIFAFFGTVMIPLYLFEYLKIGYFIIFILILKKTLFQARYTKIMKQLKSNSLEEEHLQQLEDIKRERKKKRTYFILAIIAYILLFLLYLLAMHKVQSI